MPITLGILAQSRQAVAAGSFDLLDQRVLTTNETSVVFSNLNSTYGTTYKHLQLRMVVRTTRADPNDNIRIQFNSDTGSNYQFFRLHGNGSSVSSGAGSNVFIENYRAAGSTAPANEFGASVVDILDAFNVNKNTTTRNLAGLTSEPSVWLSSGLWLNTAALTTITISSLNQLATHSRISLYGVKG